MVGTRGKRHPQTRIHRNFRPYQKPFANEGRSKVLITTIAKLLVNKWDDEVQCNITKEQKQAGEWEARTEVSPPSAGSADPQVEEKPGTLCLGGQKHTVNEEKRDFSSLR